MVGGGGSAVLMYMEVPPRISSHAEMSDGDGDGRGESGGH